ncbi:MAG TPA: flagellar biosynthesis protein FlhB [Firmicutes bacterium]|jgi:flagellar biosynthetic protein FlhB|nr:flagellar biosynthesis protein FlhB [Bacillota bacterium]
MSEKSFSFMLKCRFKALNMDVTHTAAMPLAPSVCGLLDLQLFAGDEDKTEEPTPHRRREARRRGQVMKSMEMNAAVNMLGAAFFFILFYRHFLDAITSFLKHCLGELSQLTNEMFFFDYLARMTLEQYLALVAPFLAAALFLGLLSNILQVGFLVSGETIKPQLNRINPAEGAKRILSRRALFELIKSLLKVSIIGVVSYLYLCSKLPDMLLLLGQEAGVFTATLYRILQGLALRVAVVFLFLALIDYLFQRQEFQKSLRMSRKEVRDEFKNLEGDPHLRARQRERQRAIVQQRSLEHVPEATVVITNPTHLAVALRYDEKEDQAPVMVAKGAARIAERIREIAAKNNIPIIHDPPVARMLFENVEPGEEIPEDLYRAVAEILALVYRLQEKERQQRLQV